MRKFTLTAYSKNGSVIFTKAGLPLYEAEHLFNYWLGRKNATRVERVALEEEAA